jgi:hypothetical protein
VRGLKSGLGRGSSLDHTEDENADRDNVARVTAFERTGYDSIARRRTYQHALAR